MTDSFERRILGRLELAPEHVPWCFWLNGVEPVGAVTRILFSEIINISFLGNTSTPNKVF